MRGRNKKIIIILINTTLWTRDTTRKLMCARLLHLCLLSTQRIIKSRLNNQQIWNTGKIWDADFEFLWLESTAKREIYCLCVMSQADWFEVEAEIQINVWIHFNLKKYMFSNSNFLKTQKTVVSEWSCLCLILSTYSSLTGWRTDTHTHLSSSLLHISSPLSEAQSPLCLTHTAQAQTL